MGSVRVLSSVMGWAGSLSGGSQVRRLTAVCDSSAGKSAGRPQRAKMSVMAVADKLFAALLQNHVHAEVMRIAEEGQDWLAL